MKAVGAIAVLATTVSAAVLTGLLKRSGKQHSARRGTFYLLRGQQVMLIVPQYVVFCMRRFFRFR